MNLNNLSDYALKLATDFGAKILGALALWLIGRWLIGIAANMMSKALGRQNLEPTVISYIRSTIVVVLNITLVVAILGYFGVQTTTFAALIAAAGLAIGTAWSGLLANFAAGAFLVILRPFKVGDMISAGGVVGVVEEIGLFATTINTADNIKTFVGNNKIFGDNIQNFTANPFRRVDLVAQLAHGADHAAAIRILKERLAQIPNVQAAPAPDVEILTFTNMGPVLAVRPYTANDHYWQVYFDTNRTIREALGQAGFAVPESHVAMRNS
jgi:small conductance mechanosensitive channel